MDVKNNDINTIQGLYEQEFKQRLNSEEAHDISHHLNELYVWLQDLTSQLDFELPANPTIAGI